MQLPRANQATKSSCIGPQQLVAYKRAGVIVYGVLLK